MSLPGKQHQLIKDVQAVNKNVILVLIPSGSTSIGWEQENLPGIVCAWPNGQEQGTALAKILYGEISPGGKLSTTWYRSENDLPHLHDYNIQTWQDDYGPEVGRTYMYSKAEPLYPFGYGLSYTRFEISDMELSKGQVNEMEDVVVSAKVSNIGDMDGDEIVQVYVRDVESSEIVPGKALKGFKRLYVPAGKSAMVSIKLPYEAFSYYDVKSNQFKVEEGEFEIMIGQSSEKIVAIKKVKVAGGAIPEIKVGQKKSGYFDAADQNRTKAWDHLYKDGGFTKMQSSENQDASSSWIEYEIVFIDPGVYVNTWDAELNFKSVSKSAVLEASMQGIKIDTYELQGKTKLAMKIPIPPDYGKPVRLRLKTTEGSISHKSIRIISPGNKESFVISKIAAQSK